jgi:hypothetical protein
MTPRLPLLAGAAALALTGCGASPAAEPAAGTTAVASAPTRAADPPASVAPGQSSAGSGATPGWGDGGSASPRRTDDGCPVTAAALQQVVRMPAGWRINGSSIRCSHGWAQAGVLAPAPEQQGDGVVLFAYDAAIGAWVDKGQGSSVDCAAFGIPERAGRDLPVCYYD